MFHTTLKIFSNIIPLVFFTSCALIEPQDGQTGVVLKQRLFYTSYENVWRAAQLALASYPISVNNIDTGALESDFVKANEVWKNPSITDRKSAGLKYRLLLNIAKGSTQGRPSVRVTISKKIEMQRDFFSPTELKDSDGLEEDVILYRIDRELIIEKALQSATKN